METQLGKIEQEPEHLAEISHEIFEEWFNRIAYLLPVLKTPG